MHGAAGEAQPLLAEALERSRRPVARSATAAALLMLAGAVVLAFSGGGFGAGGEAALGGEVTSSRFGPIRPPPLSSKAAHHTAEKKALTISVVLPCAFEYRTMYRTVQSVFNNTPAHILKEIIVLDDGSEPPLAPLIADPARWKAKLLRHDVPKGLIQAKQDGADAATGDIVTFLDCHVKPDKMVSVAMDLRQPAAGSSGVCCPRSPPAVSDFVCGRARVQWWEPVVKNIKENYKRVVVPTITNLNIDTWTEFGRPAQSGGGMSKCYLTFGACPLCRSSVPPPAPHRKALAPCR